MNSKSFFIGLMLIATLPSACSDDHLSMRSCVNKVLKDNGMEPYTNQEIGCNFFYYASYIARKTVFSVEQSVCRYVALPFDCDGRSLCEDPQSNGCIDFYRNADYAGIVGITAN